MTDACHDERVTDWDSPYGELIETRLRVLSWNLWWRFGPWEQRQPAIIETIRRTDADILGLQEIWDDKQANLAAIIADELGYEYVYEARLDHDGVRFGNAVVSRWPLTGHEMLPLPAPDDREELRTVVRADIDGPRGPIQLFTTHLNWRFDESHVRQDQVRAIAAFIAESPKRQYPAILCGDFNADPDSDEIRMLTGKSASPVDRMVFHDAWLAAGDGSTGMTWSNTNPYARLDLEPDRRIDYVLVGWPKAGGAGHVVDCKLVGGSPIAGIHPSDHIGVVAELRY
jgi:endonuclease/exonuclease/phosphatase family metal-dependent hydrolase